MRRLVKIIILLLILVLGFMNFDLIKDTIRKAEKQDYCYAVYGGRDYLFNKCMNENLK